VRDGRLHHEGLRVGFPDIDPELVVSSRGSIGVDGTLDLYLEMPRLDKALRREKSPARCHVTGTLDNPRIAVEDGSLVLRQHGRTEPILAADGIDLNIHVEDTPSGRVLAVEPVEVFKKRKLSLGVADDLMKCIAPDVHGERQVAGEVSLSLGRLRLPLDVAGGQGVGQPEAEGTLTLHRVESDVRSPMWQALVRVAADVNGRPPPDVIRLVADAEVAFRVRDGRLHHEGLRVGFPDIDPELVVSSRGSIGADGTLDLYLEMPRLRRAKRDKGPLQCLVTGTIREPSISLQNVPLLIRCGMARRLMRVYARACRTPLLASSIGRLGRWTSIGLQRVADLRHLPEHLFGRPVNGALPLDRIE
jgi:hypothetical protein